MAEIVITRDGLERLSAELEKLTTDGRREIADRLCHPKSPFLRQWLNSESGAKTSYCVRSGIAERVERLRSADIDPLSSTERWSQLVAPACN